MPSMDMGAIHGTIYLTAVLRRLQLYPIDDAMSHERVDSDGIRMLHVLPGRHSV